METFIGYIINFEFPLKRDGEGFLNVFKKHITEMVRFLCFTSDLAAVWRRRNWTEVRSCWGRSQEAAAVSDPHKRQWCSWPRVLTDPQSDLEQGLKA